MDKLGYRLPTAKRVDHLRNARLPLRGYPEAVRGSHGSRFVSRYYFNLYNSGGWLPDPEGIECADRQAALDRAATMIRGLVAAEIKEGKGLDLGHYIAISLNGEEIGRVYFGDAIAVKQRA